MPWCCWMRSTPAIRVSNWVTAGNAMNSLAGKGVSVAAPASGAFTLYTNWEADGTRQWETFLSDELPNWLAANKGLAPGGHAIVGAAQGGTGALMEATFHPDRYRYAGSMSGFLTPSRTTDNGAITAGMNEFGGVNTQAMWGAAQLGRWKWHDPDVHAQLLVDNNTRLWVFSPQTTTCADPAAMIGYCAIAQGSNRIFYSHYRSLRRSQRPLRLPGRRSARLGQLGRSAGRDGRRRCGGYQIGHKCGRTVSVPQSVGALGHVAAAGTVEACSARTDVWSATLPVARSGSPAPPGTRCW